MARYSGFGGSISITSGGNALTGPVQTWDLDIQQDEWEMNAKNDNYGEFAFGGKSYIVRLVFLVDAAVVASTHDLIGDEVTIMTLSYTSGDVWTMSTDDKAVVQQVAASSPVDGPVEWSIVVRGKGSISYASAA